MLEGRSGVLQHLFKVRRRHRLEEQVALSIPASQSREDLGLLLCLDPFSNDLEPERSTKRDDRSGDGQGTLLGPKAIDKGSVYLERTERVPVQVAQRGVTLAEVIQLKPYSCRF